MNHDYVDVPQAAADVAEADLPQTAEMDLRRRLVCVEESNRTIVLTQILLLLAGVAIAVTCGLRLRALERS